MPRLDHDRKVLRLPSHCQRPAVHENCDERLSGFHKFCEHLSLSARKCDIRFGGGFPGHGSGLTDDCDNHVAVFACRCQFLFIQIPLRSSACIIGDVRAGILKAVQNSDAVLLLPSHCPGTSHFICRACQGPDKADPLIFSKRQYVVVIFEKYNGFLRRFQRKRRVLCRDAFLVSFNHFFRHIRVLEEAKPDLDAEDPPNCLIDDFHRDFSALHCCLQVVLIDMGSHVHIHSRDCRLHARVRVVRRDSVDDTFLDCICITHDKAFKPQFVLKDITQQVLVHRAGDTV